MSVKEKYIAALNDEQAKVVSVLQKQMSLQDRWVPLRTASSVLPAELSLLWIKRKMLGISFFREKHSAKWLVQKMR